jgi:predicted DNA-binding transcriptional regulator AlpA
VRPLSGRAAAVADVDRADLVALVLELVDLVGRLGTADVARLLGVSRPRVWQLRARPDFPPARWRDGGRDYWSRDAIRHWLTTCNDRPGTDADVLPVPAANELSAEASSTLVEVLRAMEAVR